ncbi:MAG: hypothetical protein ACFB00_07430 [Parvularculaceae bacterium]
MADPEGVARARLGDQNRIRKLGRNEAPADLARRRRAKLVNFGCTFAARFVLLYAAGDFFLHELNADGYPNRGVAVGVLAMLADLARVTAKFFTHGNK